MTEKLEYYKGNVKITLAQAISYSEEWLKSIANEGLENNDEDVRIYEIDVSLVPTKKEIDLLAQYLKGAVTSLMSTPERIAVIETKVEALKDQLDNPRITEVSRNSSGQVVRMETKIKD